MESRNWNRWSLLLVGVALLVTTTGCPVAVPPAPEPPPLERNPKIRLFETDPDPETRTGERDS